MVQTRQEGNSTAKVAYIFGYVWSIGNGKRELVNHNSKKPISYPDATLPKEILELKEGEWFQAECGEQGIHTGIITSFGTVTKVVPPFYSEEERKAFWNDEKTPNEAKMNDSQKERAWAAEFQRMKAAGHPGPADKKEQIVRD